MATDSASTPSPDAAISSETQVSELVTDFAWDGGTIEPGLAISLSGGGFRAMLFHTGALARLNELGMLSKAKRISSVSGGSIAAGFLASLWPTLTSNSDGVFPGFKATYVDPLVSFSRQKLDVKNAIVGLLPFTSAAEQLAKSYNRFLFGGRSLQDLPDTPRFVFCASNLQTGVLWRFSKTYAGDYLVGRLANPVVTLAHAVAASSAFPPFLSPLTFYFAPGQFTDWPTTRRQLLPHDHLPAYRNKVILTDGGVYDNHGLEPVLKRYMTVLISDGGAPFSRSRAIGWDWIRQLRRILDITDNQVRALRRRDLIARLKAGNRAFARGELHSDGIHPYERNGAYWGIDTDPDSAVPPNSLPCSPTLTRKLARVSTRLNDVGATTAQQLVNWGYAICDRCVRKHYAGSIILLNTPPVWPYPEAPLGT